MSYPIRNLGNGIYSKGKCLIFDVPEMLAANNQEDTPQSRTQLANELSATQPERYPECDINIIRNRS